MTAKCTFSTFFCLVEDSNSETVKVKLCIAVPPGRCHESPPKTELHVEKYERLWVICVVSTQD